MDELLRRASGLFELVKGSIVTGNVSRQMAFGVGALTTAQFSADR
jgi:hypothetical protein